MNGLIFGQVADVLVDNGTLNALTTLFAAPLGRPLKTYLVDIAQDTNGAQRQLN